MVVNKHSVNSFIFLPILALCVDFFTPYLIWKNIIPAEIRWISHGALAAMLLISIVRMLGYNQIPISFWTIVFISVLWSFVAVGHGQGATPTIWGIWLLVQFPFVALFMYLQREPLLRFPEYFRAVCLIALILEVMVQLLQFVLGVSPGDDLSGLFGKNGTGRAALFEILVCCIFFGHWIESGKWAGLLAVLPMSVVSSVLGEMKIFAPAITVIGVGAVLLSAIKYRSLGRMVFYLAVTVSTVAGFMFLYNIIIPGAKESPIQTYLTNPSRLSSYLSGTDQYSEGGVIRANIGRMSALEIGWNSLRSNPVIFLFGYGIGTRSESRTLGTAGIALMAGNQGLSVGTSLLVIMQEMGIVGLVVFAVCWILIVLTLTHYVQLYPESPASGLRYASLLFSIFWPVWLWYATTWTERVPMLLYWIMLGYVLAESRQPAMLTASNAEKVTE